MNTKIYVIRHGEYDSPMPVAPYRLSGFHLSERGKEEVRRLAVVLALEPVIAVYSSPLERTLETAEIIAASHTLKPVVDDRLVEVASPLQGKTMAEIKKVGRWDFSIYVTTWYEAQRGETLDEIFSRVRACLLDVKARHDGQTFAIVTHGDPVMLLAAYYQGIPRIAEALGAMPYVPMAGGFRLEFADNADIASVYPIVTS